MKKREPDVTSRIMGAIHSKDTRPEILLRKELFRRGYRYRIHYNKIPGHPDIVFTRACLAIFVDGDFWHGNNWRIRGYGSHDAEMQRYSEYWQTKINRNIKHDQEINSELSRLGWIPLRIYESEIKADLSKCVNTVEYWYHLLTDGG